MPKSISSMRKHSPASRETAEKYSFTVFFEPAVEGGYVVTCPALPGLATDGDTLAEAKRMAKDAIRTYLVSLRKNGEPIPSDPKFSVKLVKEKIRVAIPA
jgi:antitoxin HicB